LIVGASGYLGSEVARLASAAGHAVTGTSSSDLDITDRAAVAALVAAVRPEIVVNAAYRADSWAICAHGAAHVALAAAGARLVQVSTDALHGGRDTPYLDDEPPTPVHGLDPDSIPVSTIAQGGLGARPADVRLDSSRAAALLRTTLRPASDCV
jgi:dTDP-4-dehydrorhamnose reductase